MDEATSTELALKYATEWYTYHASQRMIAVRFYLLMLGALLVGYHQTYTDHPDWATGIAAMAALASLVFWILDVRNTELVCCGRAALDRLEERVRVQIRADDRQRKHLRASSWIARVVLGACPRNWYGRIEPLWTFQSWLRLLFLVIFLVSLGVALTTPNRRPN